MLRSVESYVSSRSMIRKSRFMLIATGAFGFFVRRSTTCTSPSRRAGEVACAAIRKPEGRISNEKSGGFKRSMRHDAKLEASWGIYTQGDSTEPRKRNSGGGGDRASRCRRLAGRSGG